MHQTPKHSSRTTVAFQMLSKNAQKSLCKYESIVICLMILAAITAIFWSISIYILSGDFNNGFLGGNIIFHERDFSQLDAREYELFKNDLEKLINSTYTEEAALENKTTANETQVLQEKFVMPLEKTDPTTKRPKQISHVILTSNSMNELLSNKGSSKQNDEDLHTTTIVPKKKFDITADRKFLSNMTIDTQQMRWRQSAGLQFIYSFPFLSEIIAIIWTAMCLIFQMSVKKYWGLPKPWRIVLPSLVLFTIMTLTSLAYAILAQGYLKTFCTDLRSQLSRPEAISCGQAMTILRPVLVEHTLTHTVYLCVFRISYFLSLAIWFLALIVMVCRFMLAVDFQLVDIPVFMDYESKPNTKKMTTNESRDVDYKEVFLNSPKNSNQYSKYLQVENGSMQKSEDDFQSAKSHLSEVAMPLLEEAEHKA